MKITAIFGKPMIGSAYLVHIISCLNIGGDTSSECIAWYAESFPKFFPELAESLDQEVFE